MFLTELENRLGALPGVQHVAIGGSQIAFGFNSSSSFVVEGRPEPPPDKLPEMFFVWRSGAQTRDVLWLVLGKGALLILIGIFWLELQAHTGSPSY